MISYAQNFEDVILWRSLKNVEKGFYIDLGAGHPVNDSVSNWFYQNSWDGLEVEPNTNYSRLLSSQRNRNVLLKKLVGTSKEPVEYFDARNSGLSTCSPSQIIANLELGVDGDTRFVEVISLDEVFSLAMRKEVHWLKIDVEGSESDVLLSWEESQVRPWIVLVESTVPNTQVPTFEKWEPILLSKGYIFVYFDGLNRFYLHEFHKDLSLNFDSPANYFDFFELSGSASSSFTHGLNSNLASTQAELASTQAELASTQAELASTQAELASTQAEHIKTILVFQNSKSWKVTKLLRITRINFGDKEMKSVKFLVWKIRSKLAYEKRRLIEIFLREKKFQSNSALTQSNLEFLRNSQKPWVHPDLVQLTKKRLTRK